MKRTLLLGALLAVLAACANEHVYTKSGSDAERTHADMMACKSEAAVHPGAEAKAAFDRCMAGKGYEKEVSQYRF